MDIHAGGQVIGGAEVFSEREWINGMARPVMRLRLDGEVTAEQIAALSSNDWAIYDGEKLMGVHSGYTSVVRHELVLANVAGLEAEVAQITAEKAEAIAEKNTMAGEISARIDALAAEYDGYFADLLYDMSVDELNGKGGVE